MNYVENGKEYLEGSAEGPDLVDWRRCAQRKNGRKCIFGPAQVYCTMLRHSGVPVPKLLRQIGNRKWYALGVKIVIFVPGKRSNCL